VTYEVIYLLDGVRVASSRHEAERVVVDAIARDGVIRHKADRAEIVEVPTAPSPA